MSNQKKLQKIFNEAIELSSELRGKFLDVACGDDKELRVEIDSNLSGIKATQSILAPKVDAIEARLAERLKHLDHGDTIKTSSVHKDEN